MRKAVRPASAASSCFARSQFTSSKRRFSSSSYHASLRPLLQRRTRSTLLTRGMSSENLVLYYATISGISTGPYVRGKKSGPPKNKKSDSERFNTTPAKKEIPVLDLHGCQYWDTHTHIDQILRKFSLGVESFPEFRANNFKNGFGGCVTVCCDAESFEPTKKLMLNENVYAAFGIHPHNAKYYGDSLEQQILEMMDHPKTVAWGEMGLDYFYNFSDKQKQREVFARQLKKAVELNKPIVIHSRDAEEDTLALLREHVPQHWRMHVHCFTSSVSMAKSLITEWPNCFIGITGVVTFGNATGVRDVVKEVPLDRLLLETDGPFMAPMPFRGEICHSGHIPWTALKISEVKQTTIDEVLNRTRDNAKRMYGI